MKTILLTGAGGGIGEAIISQLPAHDNTIIAVIHDEKDRQKFAQLPHVTVHCLDVTDPHAIEALHKELAGPIDWMICSHGYIDSETDLEKQSIEKIEMTFKVNTFSLFFLSQAFLSSLTSGIIFISSTAGISANGRYAAYSASKAAVNSLAQGLARNRANLKSIALCPGPTDTHMRARIGAAGGQDPKEVARAVEAIISGEGAYESGDIISIRDGIIKKESGIHA